MGELLEVGEKIQTASGVECSVVKFLGGGGQGEVYESNWGGQSYALKWYFKQGNKPSKNALQLLIGKRAPNDSFLWPLQLATIENQPDRGYGYLMKLRETRFKSPLDLLSGKIDPTFRNLTTVGLNLVNSFKSLHEMGFCYCDIAFGNVFLDCETGEVAICDNDNVVENMAAEVAVATVGFTAPELFSGVKPSRTTDLYSLSVLLFRLFLLDHPLEGRRVLKCLCKDSAANYLFHIKEPKFIFDPKDLSNEAVGEREDRDRRHGANALDYWDGYPSFFKDAFTRSFTSGLHDPNNGRLTEGEWQNVLFRLRDSIVTCNCNKKVGIESFCEPNNSTSQSNVPISCRGCGRNVSPPNRMVIGRHALWLTKDTSLYQQHVDPHHQFTQSVVMADVVQNPNNPSELGLRNKTSGKWVATRPDGSMVDIPPGKAVAVKPGFEINFGKAKGLILS